MKGVLRKLKTAHRLGWGPVSSVIGYRLETKLGRLERAFSIRPFSKLPQLSASKFDVKLAIAEDSIASHLEKAEKLLSGQCTGFSYHALEVGELPNWFVVADSDWSGVADTHWAQIKEFHAEGDIKWIWELSRFEWLLDLVRAYRLSQKHQYLAKANQWLQDWCVKNPINQGPNWKCGQECALRLITVFLSLQLLNQAPSAQQVWIEFVIAHVRRIERTIYYAKAQCNNHYSSEAAAIFLAGHWLEKIGGDTYQIEAVKLQKKGRAALEDAAKHLVLNDGTFSQYSTNYHRLFIDTFSVVEWFRGLYQAPKFSHTIVEKLQAATHWLYQMVDESSGGVPNMGGNDGARFLQFDSLGYRNFKPSVQLATQLFCGHSAYGHGDWEEPLAWFELKCLPKPMRLTKTTQAYPDGGFVVMTNSSMADTHAVMRFPKFRYRPSQADCMHLDLWSQGVNILRDAGTFAYHGPGADLNWYHSIRAHNSVIFDEQDAMPKLSRFLYGDWCQMLAEPKLMTTEKSACWEGAYQTAFGAIHKRKLLLEGALCRIEDSLEGFREKATLQWRLCPEKWHLEERQVDSAMADIHVDFISGHGTLVLAKTKESLYYQAETETPLLKVEVAEAPAKIVTEIHLKSL